MNATAAMSLFLRDTPILEIQEIPYLKKNSLAKKKIKITHSTCSQAFNRVPKTSFFQLLVITVSLLGLLN